MRTNKLHSCAFAVKIDTFKNWKQIHMPKETEQLSDHGSGSYRLDDQIGFLLRRAQQRHLSIFSELMPEFTPTQFAAMAKLDETGPQSQNELGRLAGMDAATIKGVIDRLRKRGFITSKRDARDQRRIYLDLTDAGRSQFRDSANRARQITVRTVEGLSADEHRQLTSLLRKLI